MKRLAVSLTVVMLLTAAYCLWETLFVRDMLRYADGEFEKIAAAASPREIAQAGERLNEYLEKRAFLMRAMTARDVLDPVRAKYVRFSEYISQGNVSEAKVAAREMQNSLKEFRAVFP